MKNNLKTPCNECPFRTNSLPGWLGGLTAEETHSAVMTSEADFACHKTRDKSPRQMSRCAGSLQYLKQACKSPQFNIPLKLAVEAATPPAPGEILFVNTFFSHHKTTF